MSKLLKLGNSICPNIVWWTAQTLIKMKGRLNLCFPNLEKRVYANTCTIEEDILANWKIFLNEKQLADTHYLNRLKRDMIRCYFMYGINANEYFVHRFEKRTKTERQRYMSKRDKNYACRLVEGGLETFNVLNDKYNFYQIAKPFFKRDVCKITSISDLDEFLAFASNHKRCIAKPISSSWGNGCKIIDIENPRETFNLLLEKDKWIIEELIVQDDRMAAWNKSSVNTIRICSFRQNIGGGIIQIYPFMKTGREGSVVDNAGQGGIYMSISSKTGDVCSFGMDELGNVYEEHPDSHIRYENWTVPQWDDLVKISSELHQTLPKEHVYVGFDFALDKDKGWVVIEGNWGDFICQQSSLGRGLRLDFYKAIRS